MIDLDNTLFNINVENKLPQIGSFLVAEPFLREQYFNHAIILLADYFPGKSAMGIVMNKPTGYMLNELLTSVNFKDDIRVFCGGPLSSDRLFYIHRMPDLISNSTPLGNGLWIGGDFDDICSYIEQGMPCTDNIRFFIGYSGWDAGQLDSELKQKVWASTDIPEDFQALSGEEDHYWHHVVKKMGQNYHGWRFQPMNPQDN